MSSHSLRWTLFLLTSIIAGAGPFGLALAGMLDSEFEEEPAEFFCMTPDGGRGEACVSLYLDEDGYEVCLLDKAAKTERCMSNYRQPEDRGEEYDALGTSAVRLIDC
jgi:hypothetical protein